MNPKRVPLKVRNQIGKAENDLKNDKGNTISLSSESEHKLYLEHKLKRIYAELNYVEKNKPKFSLLTSREKEIINLLASGFNNPQISQRLFISRRTVEQHRKNINRKLDINTVIELCVFAYAFNLV